MKDEILKLGQIYNAQIEDEDYYQKLIEDVDFTGRSVLNIICSRGFAELMSEEDPKAENLIQKMWTGKDSTHCDGNIFGYSNIISILLGNINSTPNPSAEFMEIVTDDFKLNVDVDYLFQHRYRKEDISFLFNKELVIGLLMLIFF